MTDETPLEDRITQAIADLVSLPAPQNGNPADSYLTLEETAKKYDLFQTYQGRIAKRFLARYADGKDWTKLTIQDAKSYGEPEIGLEAARAYIKGGEYPIAERIAEILKTQDPDNDDAKQLYAILDELGVHWGLPGYEIKMVEHYVKSQLPCRILSGAANCEGPIITINLKEEIREDSGDYYTYFNLSGSCGNENHVFMGIIKVGLGFIGYEPISVPGERPA